MKSNWTAIVRLPSGQMVRSSFSSRNGNDFTLRYPRIAEALAGLPGKSVVDGEVVALDAEGRPSFNTLQNHASAGAPLYFYIFDLLVLDGRNVMKETLEARRNLLEKAVLPKLREPIRYAPVLDGSLSDLIASVKEQGLRAWWLSGATVSMSQACAVVRG